MPSLTNSESNYSRGQSNEDLGSIVASFKKRGLAGQPQVKQQLLRAQTPTIEQEVARAGEEFDVRKRERIRPLATNLADIYTQVGDLNAREALLRQKITNFDLGEDTRIQGLQNTLEQGRSKATLDQLSRQTSYQSELNRINDELTKEFLVGKSQGGDGVPSQYTTAKYDPQTKKLLAREYSSSNPANLSYISSNATGLADMINQIYRSTTIGGLNNTNGALIDPSSLAGRINTNQFQDISNTGANPINRSSTVRNLDDILDPTSRLINPAGNRYENDLQSITTQLQTLIASINPQLQRKQDSESISQLSSIEPALQLSKNQAGSIEDMIAAIDNERYQQDLGFYQNRVNDDPIRRAMQGLGDINRFSRFTLTGN